MIAAATHNDFLYVALSALIRSRLLIEANSGAGKSWLIRSLLEGTHGRIAQFVIDPEGEYFTLREHYAYILVGPGGDLPADPYSARLLCRQLMHLQASAVFDISELTLDEQRLFVRDLLQELMILPPASRHPLLVTIDEAQLFAPQGGKVESTAAVIDVCRRGRKRGLCPVLAFQRMSSVDKDAVAMLQNKLVGQTGLTNDVRRVVEELGLDKAEEYRLKRLNPGEFFAFGPALARETTLIRTGPVQTTHPEGGELSEYTPAPAPDAIAALLQQLKELGGKEAAEADTGVTEKSAPSIVEVQKIVTVEKPIFLLRDGEAQMLLDAAGNLEGIGKDLLNQAAEIRSALARVPSIGDRVESAAPEQSEETVEETAPVVSAPEPLLSLTPVPPTIQEAAPKPVRPSTTKSNALTNPQQATLDTLAVMEELGLKQPTRDQLGFFRGVKASTGSFGADLTALNTKGLIAYPASGRVALTETGRLQAKQPSALPTLAHLHKQWLGKLTNPQAETLRLLITAYQDAQREADMQKRRQKKMLSRGAIASARGVKASTGSFGADLTALKALGLVEYPADGMVAATDLLFPKGLV